MKKAVVLEIQGNYAAVLMHDGTVKKLRNNGYSVGQEIDLGEPAVHFSKQRLARAAAVAAAVLAVSGSGLVYASETVMAYSTVTVTIDDTEMELTLNRRDEVIKATALDDSGNAIAEKLEISRLRRKSLDETVSMLAEPAKSTGLKEVVSRDKARVKILKDEVQEILPEQTAVMESDQEPETVPLAPQLEQTALPTPQNEVIQNEEVFRQEKDGIRPVEEIEESRMPEMDVHSEIGQPQDNTPAEMQPEEPAGEAFRQVPPENAGGNPNEGMDQSGPGAAIPEFENKNGAGMPAPIR